MSFADMPSGNAKRLPLMFNTLDAFMMLFFLG